MVSWIVEEMEPSHQRVDPEATSTAPLHPVTQQSFQTPQTTSPIEDLGAINPQAMVDTIEDYSSEHN